MHHLKENHFISFLYEVMRLIYDHSASTALSVAVGLRTVTREIFSLNLEFLYMPIDLRRRSFSPNGTD